MILLLVLNDFNKEELTFDDVLLVPAYSEILPSHTSTHTHFNK